MLDRVSEIVRKYNADFPKFDAIWVVKATWYSMSLYGFQSNENVSIIDCSSIYNISNKLKQKLRIAMKVHG